MLCGRSGGQLSKRIPSRKRCFQKKKGLQRPFCSSCLISAERQAGHSGDISWVATMSLPTCFRFYVRKTKHSHTNVLKNIHIVSKHPLKVIFAEHLLQICQAIIHHRGYIQLINKKVARQLLVRLHSTEEKQPSTMSQQITHVAMYILFLRLHPYIAIVDPKPTLQPDQPGFLLLQPPQDRDYRYAAPYSASTEIINAYFLVDVHGVVSL